MRAAGLLAALCLAAPATAQIATDGSAGARASFDGGVALIEGRLGRRADQTLLHSFSRFDVGADDLAVFGVPGGVTRIIGRVTGGEASRIDGLISFADDATFRLPAQADFWFFNPSGVLIGEGAEFRTGGALYLSGGDSLIFSDGSRIGAEADAPLTLTSAPPEAFGFLGAPGPVVVTGAAIPAQGAGITLSGGRVELNGARLTAGAQDLALISGEAGGTAPARPARGFEANGGEIVIRGEIRSGAAALGLSTDEGGDIALHGGAITVDAAQVVAIGGAGRSGRVTLRADQLTLSDRADVGTLASGAGDAGAVRVTSGDILLTGGGTILSQTIGGGDAGAVRVTGFDTLLIDRAGTDFETAVESEVSVGAAGNAGRVTIRGRDVRLIDGGSIFSNTFGDGDAGAVEVRARSIIGSDGGQIGGGARDNPEVDRRATGAGGDVTVIASESVSFSGKLRPRPQDPPDAELESSGILTATEGRRTGRGGDLFVSAPLIILTDRAEIGAETFFDAPAGDLTLEGETLSVSGGSEISTTSRSDGAAGDVRLTFSRAVTMARDGSIASRAGGDQGSAGLVRIETGDLTIGPGSRLTTDSLATDGGAIRVINSGFAFIDDGLVTTSVRSSDGAGGAIAFSGGPLVLSDAARLESTAQQGAGGSVRIASAISFIELPDATIDVSSALGQDGTISILGVVGDQTAEAEAPPAEFFDRFALIDDFCVAAVTGGSALRLVPSDRPGGAPALFGGEIPYPAAEGGVAALSLSLEGSECAR